MENKSVRLSRAGDEFHYRWAARRCLNLLYPKSTLEYIVVEGSTTEESNLDGEYVIDVAEYYNQSDGNSAKVVFYYQLKHTIVNTSKPFNLSGSLAKWLSYNMGQGHLGHLIGQRS